MRNKYLLPIIIVSILINLLLAWQVWAGSNTDSPGGPTDSAGQMYTLQQIYDRLYDGRTSPQMTTFTEPGSGPGAGTMNTLDDIYNIVGLRAPVASTGITATLATGDDGDLERGVVWSDPRFTNNGDGTVFDNLTGLTWLKDANCAKATRNWTTALSDVTSLNSAGTMNGNDCGDTSNSGSHQTDWRLPNVRELQSLVDYGQYGPALPSGHPFIDVQLLEYWSSSTLADGSSGAWYVYLSDGYVNTYGKASPLYVWPVRGGQ